MVIPRVHLASIFLVRRARDSKILIGGKNSVFRLSLSQTMTSRTRRPSQRPANGPPQCNLGIFFYFSYFTFELYILMEERGQEKMMDEKSFSFYSIKIFRFGSLILYLLWPGSSSAQLCADHSSQPLGKAIAFEFWPFRAFWWWRWWPHTSLFTFLTFSSSRAFEIYLRHSCCCCFCFRWLWFEILSLSLSYLFYQLPEPCPIVN